MADKSRLVELCWEQFPLAVNLAFDEANLDSYLFKACDRSIDFGTFVENFVGNFIEFQPLSTKSADKVSDKGFRGTSSFDSYMDSPTGSFLPDDASATGGIGGF